MHMLVVRGRTRLGFEVNRISSPQVTPSMQNALADLKLQHLYVVHAGDQSFPMHKQIYAIGIKKLLTDLKPLSH